jgi:hypothetical protein
VSDNDRIRLQVVIANTGDRSFAYDDANLQAFMDGAPMAVITAARQEQEAERSANFKAAMVGLAGALNSANASYAGKQQTYGTANVSAYGSGGYATGTVNYHETTYDPAAAQAAQDRVNAQTSAQLASVQAERANRVASIQNGALQRTTVHPGERISGWVTLEPLHARRAAQHDIEVRLLLGSDLHLLGFRETRQ